MIALDLVLCAAILGVALAAVSGFGVFRAVVFFIVYGVMVSMAWLRLDAVDVALAEAAIGAGLTGVLLLSAVARMSRLSGAGPWRPRVNALPAALVAGGVTVALGWALVGLPLPRGLGAEVAERMPRTGVENPVTAVLLNFRAWDTALESVVLLAALIGVWSLTRDAAWGARAGQPMRAQPGGVLEGFGRLLPPLGLLVGVYLVWAGADAPGGAFQGGTVLAAVLLLMLMAGLMPAPGVTDMRWRLALVAGPAVFLGVGVAGFGWGGFLVLPPSVAKPLILGIEAALTLSIAATLALIVLGRPEPDEAVERAQGDGGPGDGAAAGGAAGGGGNGGGADTGEGAADGAAEGGGPAGGRAG